MDRESLWLRLEPLVLNLIESSGESRNSLGPKLGFSRNHLGRFLRTAEERRADRRVRPDFNLAFQIAEHYGISPTTLLAPFAHDAPEVLLQVLPCEPDKNPDRDLLEAIAALETRIVANGQRLPDLWDERRSGETELAKVYAELEELEYRRHYAAHEVAETCRTAILDAARCGSEPFGYIEAIRLTGITGIWGSVQRRDCRLSQAREALSRSLVLARRVGDPTLYANLLQRCSYVFRELKAAALAVQVLRKASELFRVDGNETSAACTLVDRATVAFANNRIREAQDLYAAGVRLLSRSNPSNPTYFVAAVQGLATCRDLLGDVQGALTFLASAAEEADPRHDFLRASLIYTAANIERRLGLYGDAESKYWNAIQTYLDYSDADAVLVVCLDLAVCLLASGRKTELPAVRKVVEAQLPNLRHRKTLQYQYELLIRELARESTTISDLRRIAEII